MEGRKRQSEVLLRLKDMEHGSEDRVKVVTREIAKVREEARLDREQACQRQKVSSIIIVVVTAIVAVVVVVTAIVAVVAVAFVLFPAVLVFIVFIIAAAVVLSSLQLVLLLLW